MDTTKNYIEMYKLAPLIRAPDNVDLPLFSGPNSMYQLSPLVSLISRDPASCTNVSYIL